MKSENFDLILSGLQSDDLGLSQTGVLIGEMLGYSTATLVVETVIEGNSLKVKRELESGWFQWVSFPFPASISIQSGLNSPRYPSLKGIMGAKKKGDQDNIRKRTFRLFKTTIYRKNITTYRK